MEFSELFRRIKRRLRMLARKHKRPGSFFDEEDLYQEMCSYLWCTFKDGVPAYMNDTYIIRGCEFYILNYLRTQREKVIKVSLEEEINEEGDTFKEILADRQEALASNVDKKMLIDHILNDGFSKREKEVFSLLIKGHTVREAGRMLGISHVMVVKLKSRIIRKYQKSATKRVTRKEGYLLN